MLIKVGVWQATPETPGRVVRDCAVHIPDQIRDGDVVYDPETGRHYRVYEDGRRGLRLAEVSIQEAGQ